MRDMSNRLVPPSVEVDPTLANELARYPAPAATAANALYPIHRHHSPFKDYVRMLTPDGGVLILYKGQDRHPFLTMLRVFAWIMATGVGGWLIFYKSSLSGLQSLLALTLLMLINALLACRRIEVAHSVEIRPDAMIIDGQDVFYAEDIGDNWPELKMKDDDPDRMVIGGICGTRFIEYMTANRLDKNDRTPERLGADLAAAIEQLWGRREVTFTDLF
jgi:hypothetical protein